MLSRTETVEKELEVEVPAQYAAFLEKYGIYDPPGIAGIEVYGINEKLLSYGGIPCVIGATEIYRRGWPSASVPGHLSYRVRS